jgi:hypothetical protein
MKATVPGKNGKLKGTAPRKAGRPKPTTHPARPLRSLDDDHNLARGFRLEDLLTELADAPVRDEDRLIAVEAAITARADEWEKLNVFRRFFTYNHERLSAAFSAAPVAERFLFEELMLEAADYHLKCEPEQAGWIAKELPALATRAANRLRFYAGVMRRGEPDPAAPEMQTTIRPEALALSGALLDMEVAVNESMALAELLLGIVKESDGNGTLNWGSKLAGLMGLVSVNQQNLLATFRAAHAAHLRARRGIDPAQEGKVAQSESATTGGAQ